MHKSNDYHTRGKSISDALAKARAYEAEHKKDGVFRLKFAADRKFYTVIEYRPATGIVTVDRADSGIRFDIVQKREFYVRDRQGAIDLRMILDKDSCELYVNGGEQTSTGMIFTDLAAEDIRFSAEGGAVMDVECHIL